jgi:ribonuclease-3
VGARPDLSRLEEVIGYRFRDRGLLREAMTHTSYYHEHPGEEACHNERLEFLGDSVLGLSVAHALYNIPVCCDESTMSKIKSYVVKKGVLAERAAELELGRFMLLGKGEEETGGREKDSILADAMEAVIGAVHQDGGFDAARDLVLRLLGPRLEDAVNTREYHDYKTELQEQCQIKFGELPEYRLAGEEGQEHEKVFAVEVFVTGVCSGRGRGANKKEAQQAAAREALRNLGLQKTLAP